MSRPPDSTQERAAGLITLLDLLDQTILITTHDMHMVKEIFPRSIIMDGGVIVGRRSYQRNPGRPEPPRNPRPRATLKGTVLLASRLYVGSGGKILGQVYNPLCCAKYLDTSHFTVFSIRAGNAIGENLRLLGEAVPVW